MLSISFYDLYADIDVLNGFMKANCGIKLENKGGEPVGKVTFLLNRGLTVNLVKCMGRHANFTQQLICLEDLRDLEVNFIEITFDEPLNLGDFVRLAINYEGSILDYQHVFEYVRDSITEVFTLIRPDAYSYPVIGTLQFRDSIPLIVSQQFDYKLKIRVPRGYVVASFGKLVNEIGFDDKVLYIYESKLPSYRIDFAVAKFKKISDRQSDLHVFVFEEDYKYAVRILDELKKTLKFYSDWFGSPLKWAGFTIIEIPSHWGGQANLTGILLSDEVFRNPSRISKLYHELAHLWCVKSREKYVSRFFDEGLASYLQLLAERSFLGEEYFNKQLERFREKFMELAKRNPRLFEVSISKYGEYMLTDASYYIGAFIFYVLHRLIGDERFKMLIRALIEKYGEDGVIMDDFKKLIVAICGEKFGSFIDEWIYGNEPAKLLKSSKSFNDVILECMQKYK